MEGSEGKKFTELDFFFLFFFLERSDMQTRLMAPCFREFSFYFDSQRPSVLISSLLLRIAGCLADKMERDMQTFRPRSTGSAV